MAVSYFPLQKYKGKSLEGFVTLVEVHTGREAFVKWAKRIYSAKKQFIFVLLLVDMLNIENTSRFNFTV